jgi:hypothetical protein
LRDFFANLLPLSKVQLKARESRLSPFFTVAIMVDVCVLKVDWTNSPEDHLFLDRQTTTLWIFPKRASAAYLSELDGSSGGMKR